MPRILIVDDNPNILEALKIWLSIRGVESTVCETPEAGLKAVSSEKFELVIQDMNFEPGATSGKEGVQLFHSIRALRPDQPIVLLTAWAELGIAVDLVQAGAVDYLGKPWSEERLEATLRKWVVERGALPSVEAQAHRRSLGIERGVSSEKGERIVRGDPLTEQLVRLARQFARSVLPVLVTGPNGSGKEEFARLIHRSSPVADGPFVPVNCGAIPDSLLEAELFGANAGAYTGANRSRDGLFSRADGGTLFLDEIGNLSPSGQAKLLRVLETGSFLPLGTNQERFVSVRIVSATNADLHSRVEDGLFREDLYHRLNTLELEVPALSRRRGDILPLVEAFLDGRAVFTREAQASLLDYDWPGNVRELKNFVEKALVTSNSTRIGIQDLRYRRSTRARSTTHRVARTSDPITSTQIEEALRRNDQVVSRAAQQLGISRQAFYRKMQKFKIERVK